MKRKLSSQINFSASFNRLNLATLLISNGIDTNVKYSLQLFPETKIKDIEYSNGTRIKEYLIIKDEIGFMEVSKRYGKLSGPWVKWYSQGKKEEEGKYKNGIKVGTWSKYSMDGTVIEEWNYDNKGRNLYEITYYDNGTVKQYRDFFSKTVQEYNIDGSLRGDRTPFN